MKILKIIILGPLILVALALIIGSQRKQPVEYPFPEGKWDIYFIDENGASLHDVEVELSRSRVFGHNMDVVNAEFDAGKRTVKAEYCNHIPFDNFLTEEKIILQTGHLTLFNTRELVNFKKYHRYLWICGVHEGESIDVILKAEAKNHKSVLIDYKDICYSEKPVVITLSRN